MPHPIYGDPNHVLESVELRLYLPARYSDGTTRLTAYGQASTCRTALWSISETWSPADVHAGLLPTEAAHHILLVASQDHPTSQRQMEACMVGEGWAQDPLPM